METSFKATQDIIETILAATAKDATKVLNAELRLKRQTHPQFYDGVIKHGPL